LLYAIGFRKFDSQPGFTKFGISSQEMCQNTEMLKNLDFDHPVSWINVKELLVTGLKE